ncbi:MAG: hypothetical protein PHH58_09575 [Rhodoferax sp.]|nr:hypothetical protein [Rhodoferax sp.]
MTTMSIRGVDDQVLSRLKQQAAAEGSSLNSVVLRLLQGTGKPVAAPKKQKFDDLDALVGTWSARDADTFARDSAAFSEVDAAQWR